jgi:hypothetical protein
VFTPSTHLHDVARVIKNDNWVEEIGFESRVELEWMNFKLKRWNYNGREQRGNLNVLTWVFLEGSASKGGVKEKSNLVNSQRTSIEFILNGAHTIT